MSTQRADGEYYDACAQRCQPICGFLLCGLQHQPPSAEAAAADDDNGRDL
jgi:hypothetical protein